MAAIACVPTTATKEQTCVRIDATALDVNDSSTYDANTYPTETPYTYYIEAVGTGGTTLRSEEFGGPAFSVQGWMFDKDATYTVSLRDASDDSEVVSTTIVVS
jgi:hypothetical protein